MVPESVETGLARPTASSPGAMAKIGFFPFDRQAQRAATPMPVKARHVETEWQGGSERRMMAESALTTTLSRAAWRVQATMWGTPSSGTWLSRLTNLKPSGRAWAISK
jgi:hypothetical protein